MHAHSLERWQHSHVFLGADHERNERELYAQRESHEPQTFQR